jgi:hypothetical protein
VLKIPTNFCAFSDNAITPNKVDWIMEGKAPFANFGEITFINCIAIVGTSKSDIYDFSIRVYLDYPTTILIKHLLNPLLP